MARPFAQEIPPRRLDFRQETKEKNWCQKDPWLSYHFNAMALLVPLLEFMVIGCIRQVEKKITDPNLTLEVNSLLLQEANHSHAFIKFNKEIVALFYGKEILTLRFDVWRKMVGVLPQSMRLGACAFGEHLALIGSEMILKEPIYLSEVDPEYANLWFWHAIEEIEHKHVAFDVYRHFHKNYVLRVLSMFLFLGLFLYHYHQVVSYMMKVDRLSKWKGFLHLGITLWIKPGLFRKLFCPLISFAKPFFHPNQRNNINLMKYWKKNLFSKISGQI